jgi:hypothetical protein
MAKDRKFKREWLLKFSGTSKGDEGEVTFAESLFSTMLTSVIYAWNNQHKTTKVEVEEVTKKEI